MRACIGRWGAQGAWGHFANAVDPSAAPCCLQVLLTEMARDMSLTTMDSEVDEVLHRQGALMDAMRVLLRGSGVCLYRNPTANTRCAAGPVVVRWAG